MNILINASGIKKGGGLQVADSILKELPKYKEHFFLLVLSNELWYFAQVLCGENNMKIENYNFKKNFFCVVSGRNSYLDNLVIDNNIDAVLTIFGPSIWVPRCLHISGFARAQILLKKSPLFKVQRVGDNIKFHLKYGFIKFLFYRCSAIYYTENPYISELLKVAFPKKNIYTVTNYYNQVFDHREQWNCDIVLPKFYGFTILTVSSNYRHKNLSIIAQTVNYLRNKYPHFSFRFVVTIDNTELHFLNSSDKNYVLFVGKVDVSQCPFLYSQANVMLLPSLMECFSASYPESMRMRVPIITTDLEFAHSLCGDAALYYGALSPSELGETIYTLANDEKLRDKLILNGISRLKIFDTYEARVGKIINIIEREYSNKKNA
jgi:glycosyltransferase involved in cell wall biosynthesis